MTAQAGEERGTKKWDRTKTGQGTGSWASVLSFHPTGSRRRRHLQPGLRGGTAPNAGRSGRCLVPELRAGARALTASAPRSIRAPARPRQPHGNRTRGAGGARPRPGWGGRWARAFTGPQARALLGGATRGQVQESPRSRSLGGRARCERRPAPARERRRVPPLPAAPGLFPHGPRVPRPRRRRGSPPGARALGSVRPSYRPEGWGCPARG